MHHFRKKELQTNLWKLLKVSLVVVLGFGLFIFIGSEW
jgi:hypothetical protein